MNDTNAFFQTRLPSSGKPVWISQRPRSSDPMEDILSSGLSVTEKREILSSWASDARAVPDAPALRRLDNGAIVEIDHILDALKTLDASDLEARFPETEEATNGRARFLPNGWIQAVFSERHADDDDDDPPPCPAVIAPSPRLPPSGAEVYLEAA